MVSARAQVVTRRTYNRQKPDGSFETWAETISRVIDHQRWLWERAAGRSLNAAEEAELSELYKFFKERKMLPGGRILWLGGTETGKKRESSLFNCSHLAIRSIHDAVDLSWLLLQGCGVGFRLDAGGMLNGFGTHIEEIKVIRSTRTTKDGNEHNIETWEADTKTWTIRVGDSGAAWAKAIGKLLAGKWPARVLQLDLSEIRPAGTRLSNYGWISDGDSRLSSALLAIANILNRKSGQLLSALDVMDICNWAGFILSNRRAAEIALHSYGVGDWESFARAKYQYWQSNPQRAQSNNSLIFWERPTKQELLNVMQLMLECGGSEPGIINGQEMRRRAPWAEGVNPCSEILLGDKSFCNLSELALPKFDSSAEMRRGAHLLARANYRQTQVNLRDEILQSSWHENNQFLRLCGVGLTGIVQADLHPHDYAMLERMCTFGAFGMAAELGTPYPKNITTIKPSGTVSKIMDVTEGVHKPIGRYIFNNITFSKHDPLLKVLEGAGYHVYPHPLEADSMLVAFPVAWDDVIFGRSNELEYNNESAITQLNRYKSLMRSYVQQNCSVTIYYSPDEIPDIVNWLHDNWDNYVGVSFIIRHDPSKSAKDLGYLYLPQEVVTKETFLDYTSKLTPINIDTDTSVEWHDIDAISDCEGGMCPVR